PDENEDLYLASIVFHKIRRKQLLKINKISKNGNVLWSKIYPEKTITIFSIWKQPDETLIMAGGVQDTAGNYPAEGSAFLMKTDATGNLLWEKSYKFGERGSIYEMFQTGDGYILKGSGYSDRPTGLEHQIFLYKTDLEGSVQWKKDFQMNEAGGGLLIIPLKNGNFYGVLENPTRPTRLFTLTPSGDILQEINIPDTGITSVIEKEDGQLIFFQTERIKRVSGQALKITYVKALQADSLVTLKKLSNENPNYGFNLVSGDFYTVYGHKNKLTIEKLTPDFEVAAVAAVDLPEYTTTDGFLITDQKSLVVVGILALPLEHVDPAAKSKFNYDTVIKKVSLDSLFKK
ncbi:MAG: hypothetical protein ABIP44_04425, partial [Pseudoxanthomonas sp.]